MEVVAHALWASAAVMTAKRCTKARIPAGWTVWWAAFPRRAGIRAIIRGRLVAAGRWRPNSVGADGHILPHVHVARPPSISQRTA
jgi:hypothetical protein